MVLQILDIFQLVLSTSWVLVSILSVCHKSDYFHIQGIFSCFWTLSKFKRFCGFSCFETFSIFKGFCCFSSCANLSKNDLRIPLCGDGDADRLERIWGSDEAGSLFTIHPFISRTQCQWHQWHPMPMAVAEKYFHGQYPLVQCASLL